MWPVDLRIPTGETTVLLGESGSGKSTLLRLMVGLVSPDEGTVAFEGHPLTPASLSQARRRMGYVIQEGGLFPHMTVRANVTVMASHLRWAADRILARLEALAGLAGLEAGLLDRYPGELSGGQRQRVSLMRALMLDPRVLLLDEPLGALDPVIRRRLQRELKGIFQSLGKTVVMVTHDVAEAAFFADRVVLMRNGRILQQGRLAELAARPADAYVSEFINAQRAPLEELEAALR
ncbi:MAG: ATP-binding cassette domain-containing protein [Gammaproteobacteria bacterium]